MSDMTPGELAERLARLDDALREARALQAELRQKMAARARHDQQAVSGKPDPKGRAPRRPDNR